ncbi:MAG: hypothetical protein HYZ53_12095 [Planctomycetes bacterium]|nr:hypothetical protein [Planctomycetota bacterium]
MTIQDFLKNLCERTGWKLSQAESGDVCMTIPLKDGRIQKVFVTEFTEEGASMARVRSIIGPVSSLIGDRALMALKMNATLRYGAFAIDKDNLILADTHLLDSFNPEQKVQSILYVAEQADRFERLLFKEDRH